ncbi:MAG: hypothetical protein FJ207_03270 [Gemmatimonadetes bacterium]|nr:hypothetical protein [Gemmatimonadota bacterium]
MRRQLRSSSLLLMSLAAAVVLGGGAPVAAQSRAGPTWTPPRTPDGRPDLQGIWTNATLTPLERPLALGDRAFLTDEEASAIAARAAGQRANADAAATRAQAAARGDVGSYNQVWFDSGTTNLPTGQTSLVVDPPDGRVPLRPQAEQRRDFALARSADEPEYMSVWDRCISRGAPGWVIPAGYNNGYQIVQTSDFVVIHSEMIHDARIIPLDGRPPLPPSLRLWEGDSRGHWEGDTLVVETTNFGDRNWIATSAASGRIKGIPQSTSLRIVERFTRVAADRIDYEARIEDPEVFTQPWTLAFPLMRDDEYLIYEYACHEGNRAVEGVLRGARYQERTEANPR